MQNKEEKYPYTSRIIYDKDNRDKEDFLSILVSMSVKPEDVLYVNPLRRFVEKDKDQTYRVVLTKEIADKYDKDREFQTANKIVIKKDIIINKPLRDNMTDSGFHISTQKHDPQSIINLFTNFEKHGFLIKDSYEIIFPRPYPDGTSRKYFIVIFKKQNNHIPKKFIRKLKSVLNNSIVDEVPIKVNWLSKSVKKDILEGENKNFKEKQI